MKVLWNRKLVGLIDCDNEGRMKFRYDASWRTTDGASALSLCLPLDNDEMVSRNGHRWFANLLPEGSARDSLCRSLGIAVDNDAALLSRIGRDCAGAIQVFEESEEIPGADRMGEDGYERISGETLEMLTNSRIPYRRAVGDGLIRLSLAGAQDKWLVKWDGRDFFLPRGNSPSTHIVKFPRSEYPTLATNEAFTTYLASRCGLPVPESRVYGNWLIVTRYDRVEGEDGRVQRIHQEDFCQALGYGPKLKYQEDGGPGLSRISELIRAFHSRPALDLNLLIRWQIFNLLVGNADGHSKNLSRIPEDERGRLAPFYDLVSTALYPDLSVNLAMSIGHQADPGQVCRGDWEAMAIGMKLKSPLIFRELDSLIARLSEGLDEASVDFLSGSPDADQPTTEKICTLLQNRIRRTRTLL